MRDYTNKYISNLNCLGVLSERLFFFPLIIASISDSSLSMKWTILFAYFGAT